MNIPINSLDIIGLEKSSSVNGEFTICVNFEGSIKTTQHLDLHVTTSILCKLLPLRSCTLRFYSHVQQKVPEMAPPLEGRNTHSHFNIEFTVPILEGCKYIERAMRSTDGCGKVSQVPLG